MLLESSTAMTHAAVLHEMGKHALARPANLCYNTYGQNNGSAGRGVRYHAMA